MTLRGPHSFPCSAFLRALPLTPDTGPNNKHLQKGRIVGDNVRVAAAVQRVQLRADLLSQLVGLDVKGDYLHMM